LSLTRCGNAGKPPHTEWPLRVTSRRSAGYWKWSANGRQPVVTCPLFWIAVALAEISASGCDTDIPLLPDECVETSQISSLGGIDFPKEKRDDVLNIF
jgi:hypothetical protein